MKSLLYVLSAMAVIGLAFWAYRENYQTQAAIDQAERLQNRIMASRARLSMLRAEWAYLNRPDRLRELAEMNFTNLKLQPIDPAQFGKVTQVRYPDPVLPLVFNEPVDVSTMNRPTDPQAPAAVAAPAPAAKAPAPAAGKPVAPARTQAPVAHVTKDAIARALAEALGG
ncbi:cell division protein FtsL [Pseudooceanicola sediminis]|uniref:cell division protein FtsL n=1 Tax=Pseudooceanicola sediminis TaxID=2211117 RepID=UPI00268E4D1A|nr:cell division protein FtsL [Pseudooceanicola sediminis]|tara:strand:+ start:2286 stop:2792 length:507 start_codon:yes stop_codon:yes gene_type:complete